MGAEAAPQVQGVVQNQWFIGLSDIHIFFYFRFSFQGIPSWKIGKLVIIIYLGNWDGKEKDERVCVGFPTTKEREKIARICHE